MNNDRIVEELVKLNTTVSKLSEKAESAERRLNVIEGRLIGVLIAISSALLVKLFL